MKLAKLIPENIRIKLRQIIIQQNYDVKLGKRALAYQTSFEGMNILRAFARISDSEMGFGSYISEHTNLKKVSIGKYTCIGPNVKNFFGQHPSNKFVSIHPAFYSVAKQAGFSFVDNQLFEEHKYVDDNKRFVNIIGNDIWVGSNVLIMEGVIIGDGSIIASGAVVTKDVEPYSIVGGVPAKEIRRRFSDEQITHLRNIKWWNKDLSWIKKNAAIFSDINEFLNKYNIQIDEK